MRGDAPGAIKSEMFMYDSPLFRVRNVGMDFGTRKVRLDNVDIPRGRLVSIVGPSGAGKSTWLHLLGGLCVPNWHGSTGSCEESRLDAILPHKGRWVTYDLRKPPSRAFQAAVAFVFQNPLLLQSATSSANIALGSASAGRPVDLQRIAQLAQTLGIEPSFLPERSRARSAGERQRIALARALVRDPTVVFADEPTANLDPPLAEEVITFLKAWCSTGLSRSVIWVTHDVHLAARFADDVVALHDGAVGKWSTWPQANPGDPRIIRRWIEGCGEQYKGGARVEPRDRPAPRMESVSTINGSTLAPPISGRKCPAFEVWMRIGISEVFSGDQADRVPFLRRITGVGTESEKPATTAHPLRAHFDRASTPWQCWAAFGSKVSVARLGLLITAITILWSTLHQLRENLYETLNSPTLNPIVITSRAQIDDHALSSLQRQLAVQNGEASGVPDIFGRYEFGSRRVSARRARAGSNSHSGSCATPETEEQMEMDIGALDPIEPMLSRVELNGATGRPASEVLIDRSDGLWNALISVSAREQLRRGLRLEHDASFICLELRGTWMLAEIVGVMITPPRGRHGPYEVIVSATQWRDFGSAEDRALYETAAIYFDSNPTRATKMVSLVRAGAAQINAPPNTRLVQSLANNAGFERIASALERTFLSTLFVGFLAIVAFFMTSLMVSEFTSGHVEKNVRAISVALAFGAGIVSIVLIEITRLAIVLVASAFLALLLVTIFATMQAVQLVPLHPAVEPADLLGRFLVVLPVITGAALTLTVAVTWLRICWIRNRSLTDQLKALE